LNELNDFNDFFEFKDFMCTIFFPQSAIRNPKSKSA